MTTVAGTSGAELHAFAAELYPICRSITGDGVRQTLKLIARHIDLEVNEIRSGTKVFDWEVPLEWNIEDAWVASPDGERVVDFQTHNLHIVNYSEPVDTTLSLDELRPRLYSNASYPDWIPYRTSYYRRHWGFCLRHRDLDSLPAGNYRAVVHSSLAAGSLSYGECLIPGREKHEVLLFTHVCHPSLANDNTSGMSIATALASWIASAPRRYTYRLVFAPGTIGSLCWLGRNERRLHRVRHGLVMGLLGDPAPFTYKQSRRGDCEIDRLVEHVVRSADPQSRVIPFEPYGYDERQLCSPGFNLPVGRLTRSVNDGYPQYHSSGDDLQLVSPERLERSLGVLQQVVEALETNRRYLNLAPKGEPRLGKRGLYGAVGGRSPADRERAMLWVLNQSDGQASLLDIAARSGLAVGTLGTVAEELTQARLLKEVGDGKPKRTSATRTAKRPQRRVARKKGRKR
jgi:aminopeptidase-like protein